MPADSRTNENEVFGVIRFVPWFLVATMAVSSGWLLHRLDREHRVNAELNRAFEAEKLRAAQQIVAERHDRGQLLDKLDDLKRRVPELEKALAKTAKIAPRARPVAIVGVGTSPIKCEAPRLPEGPKKAVCDPCALRPGQPIEIGLSGVVAETGAGNLVLTGVGTAYRLEPTREVLGSAAFDYRNSEFFVLATPPSPARVSGWSFGPMALVSTHGWAAGISIGAPPLHFGSWQRDVLGSVGLGSVGASGAVSLLFR